ncbi:MAG TPA: hypothetical protein DEB06_07555 [Phycisphaerales bacterium]|nr:hypothetical protein [Phycisphaerales bacterium]
MNIRSVSRLAPGAALALIVCAAHAQWVEVGDAGQDGIEDAQLTHPVLARGGGGLSTIAGALASPADVDLYCIRVVDRTVFQASTSSLFDTILYLFDVEGNAIVLNDDAVGVQSTITGALIPDNGIYFIAIGGFFAEALDENGAEIFQNGADQVPPQACPGVARPACNRFRGRLAGFGLGAEQGPYTISFTGADYCTPREPVCFRAPSPSFPTIQDAISFAENGDTILVPPGTHPGALSIFNKMITLRSERGPTETTIDALGALQAVELGGDIGPRTVLEGFTLIDSTGATPGGGTDGVFLASGAPLIRDCRFPGAVDQTPILVQGTASPTFDRCAIENAALGGSIAGAQGGIRFANCLFRGVEVLPSVTVTGPGAFVELIHCTIQGGTGGAAVASSDSGVVTGVHNIVWDNPGGQFAGFDPNTAFQRSLFLGGTGSNISMSPQFLNPSAADLRPGPGSPAIDAGQCARLGNSAPNALRIATPYDLDGRARFVDAVSIPGAGTACAAQAIPDLGCYEASAGAPAAIGPAFCLGDADGNGFIDFDDITSVLSRWLTFCP